MEIRVKWDVNVLEGERIFSLSDLNIYSKDVWESLSEPEQKIILQQAIDDLPEQPYMIISDFRETIKVK